MRLATLYRKGFTLIELLVVIAVIGILAAVVTANLSQTSAKSRDTERKSALTNLQVAIEAYKNRFGHYPQGCNAAGSWSGQIGSAYACSGTDGQYIPGLAPEFIPVLPIDPKLPSGRTDVGYAYVTNAEGTVYKIMAMNTVEAESLSTMPAYGHPFKSCPIEPRVQADGSIDNLLAVYSICGSIWNGVSAITPPDCRIASDRFKKSYGLWGGFAATTGNIVFPITTNTQKIAIKPTTDILCK